MPGKTLSVALASATQRASHALTREPTTPFPAEAPFPTPSQDTWYPPTHACSPDIVCACCVRRLTALDLVAHGGTTLVGTTFTGTFLACATLTGASAHRHLARWYLACRRLAHSPAPRSSAPRSWTPRSPAPRSPVRRLAVSTCTSSGARRLAREEVRDGWREDARARLREHARARASARARLREDARARGEDVAGRGTCSAVWLGPLLRGRS